MVNQIQAPERIWATPTNYRGWDVAVCSKTNVDGDSTAYVRADIHDALAAENEAQRTEVERLQSKYTDMVAIKDIHQSKRYEYFERAEKAEAERDQFAGQLATACRAINKLAAERGQALAQLAAAQMDMRERAAVKCFEDQGRFDTPDRIRAIPIDPDAQKALDKMLAQVREDAIREAAHLIECDGDALGGKSGAAKAILALLNDGGQDE